MKYTNISAGIFTVLSYILLALTNGCGGGGGSSHPASQAALVSIAVTPAASTLDVGKVTPFFAMGTYSDSTTRDLTASASWTSSAVSVASVSNTAGTKGSVTAYSAGTTVISASFLGIVSNNANLTVTPGGSTANVMPISVDGSLCSASTSDNYLNKACVSVTICNPGTSVCQTLNDILLDTGSYGLRIFRQAIPNLSLPSVASGSGSLAECTQFADGSSFWGPIQLAGVQLGNEPAVQIPIQVVDASLGTRPSACANSNSTPVSAGLTGILGVGVFNEDCGPGCSASAANGIYYSCAGSSCQGAAVPLANQVQNPVGHLAQDNNGVLVQLPAVPLGGVFAINGSLILGVGTQTNNSGGSPTVFPNDSNGDFRTVLDGANNPSFLDTGSNALFFPSSDPLLPVCPAPNSEWYCPPLTRALLATNVGAFGVPSASASFTVGNFLSLVGSSRSVFSEIAGPSAFGFDWGLPFFMGRNVFFGLEGKPGLGNTGPYVAY